MYEDVDYYNRSPKLRVTVNHPILKTRQPTEKNMVLNGEKGRIIQRLNDGYKLIVFDNLFDRDRILKGSRYTNLQWYVHGTDLTYDKQ